ncbi:DUF2184 domain-containing protein [Entomobacter blattae]|uniref:Major capsid protein n=1 Tax=Entomobacter blattae TaxID=2762277 RepID=A0A7H1NTZ9_9PROT|nr:DUF2184 domain-containing protein [Entomobacter blattae]QNT79259.1 hypothetical protein JGUZn3_20540 [Entomobacter blattae]
MTSLFLGQNSSPLRTRQDAIRDAAGNFFISQLERLDQKLYMPLMATSWQRDIDLREDVSLGNDVSSFIQTNIGSLSSAMQPGISWIKDETTSIGAVNLDQNKVENPLHFWGQTLQYTVRELEKSLTTGQPIDEAKFEAIRLKYNMDMDRLVYIGDPSVNTKGLLTNGNISTGNATVSFTDGTVPVESILSDFNSLLNRAWKNSGYAAIPTKVLMSPSDFSALSGRLNSQAGNSNVLEYISRNCITATETGRPLEIRSVKWLENAGPAVNGQRKKRMVAYTQRPDIVRIPVVPLQRSPMLQDLVWFRAAYYGLMGGVEFVYPETMAYMDTVDTGSLGAFTDYNGVMKGT